MIYLCYFFIIHYFSNKNYFKDTIHKFIKFNAFILIIIYLIHMLEFNIDDTLRKLIGLHATDDRIFDTYLEHILILFFLLLVTKIMK